MKLFLECKPDETLAIALGVPRRAIIHSHGKGRISNNLKKHVDVLAMVDDDLGATDTPTLRQFAELSSEGDVVLKVDRSTKNRLVVICPRLEPWVLKTAKDADIKMEDHGLPGKLRDLDEVINFRLVQLAALVKELVERKSPRILRLRSFLADTI